MSRSLYEAKLLQEALGYKILEALGGPLPKYVMTMRIILKPGDYPLIQMDVLPDDEVLEVIREEFKTMKLEPAHERAAPPAGLHPLGCKGEPEPWQGEGEKRTDP